MTSIQQVKQATVTSIQHVKQAIVTSIHVQRAASAKATGDLLLTLSPHSPIAMDIQ